MNDQQCEDGSSASSDSEDAHEDISAVFSEPQMMAAATPPLNVTCGDFVITKLIYNFGTRKETEKKFIGRVELVNTGRQRDQYEIKFLKKVVKQSDNDDAEQCNFVFPTIPDQYLVGEDQIIKKVVC